MQLSFRQLVRSNPRDHGVYQLINISIENIFLPIIFLPLCLSVQQPSEKLTGGKWLEAGGEGVGFGEVVAF